MVSNATFNTISVDIVAVSFIGKETGVHRETAVLPQVTDKISLIMLHPVHLATSGI
jgi:hypothetical protein